jgi:flagellar basal-body rod modification protein FlgD
MQVVEPVTTLPQSGAQGTGATANERTATGAFGLGFEDLLRIILTQLTYQDPLKPVENYEFVSQLAQFSQIQQTEAMSTRLEGILRSESTSQATSLLGRIVDIPSGPGTLTGKVVAVSFVNNEPRLTVETANPRTTIGNIAVSAVSRITEEP